MKVRNFKKQYPTNPAEKFNAVASKFTRAVKQNEQVNFKTFSCQMHDVCDVFVTQNQKHVFNNKAKNLAEIFVNLGNEHLAGILYSLLIKLNKGNNKLLEQLATNALIIAKRQHDPVHIMARAKNLKDIYKITAPNSKKYMSVLYDEKRALSDICRNYENCKKRHSTLTRQMKPIEVYQYMLASVKIEIALNIMDSNPKLAKQELLEAQQLIDEKENPAFAKKIAKTLSELG